LVADPRGLFACRSGTPLDPESDPSAHKLSADAPHYLVVDTNVALHQVGAGPCCGSSSSNSSSRGVAAAVFVSGAGTPVSI
jgi:hypothetical protein